MNPPKCSDVYTTNEVAEELKVTSAQVRQMILKGELVAEKFGRDLMITAEAVSQAKNHKTIPSPSPTSKGAGKAARATKG